MKEKEQRLLEIVKELVNRACNSYDPNKMQSSYVSNGELRDRIIEEGVVRNAGEYMELQRKMLPRIKRAITMTGNKHSMEYCRNSLCMYPKDD